MVSDNSSDNTTLMAIEQKEAISSMAAPENVDFPANEPSVDTLGNVGSTLNEPLVHTVENEKADTCLIGDDGVDKVSQAQGDNGTSSDCIPEVNATGMTIENAQGTGETAGSCRSMDVPSHNHKVEGGSKEVETAESSRSMDVPCHNNNEYPQTVEGSGSKEVETAESNRSMDVPCHNNNESPQTVEGSGSMEEIAADRAEAEEEEEEEEEEAVERYSNAGIEIKEKYAKLRDRQKKRIAMKAPKQVPSADQPVESEARTIKIMGSDLFPLLGASSVANASPQTTTQGLRSNLQGFGIGTTINHANNGVFQGRQASLQISSNHGNGIIPQGAPQLYNQQQTQLGGASILGLNPPPSPPPTSLSLYENQFTMLGDGMQMSDRSRELREQSHETWELWSDRETDYLWLGVKRHGCNWDAILQDRRLEFAESKTAEHLSRKWEEGLRKALGRTQYDYLRQKYPSSSSSSAGITERLMLGQRSSAFQSFSQMGGSSTVLPSSSLTNHQTLSMHNNIQPFSTNQNIPHPRFPSLTSSSLTNHQTLAMHNNVRLFGTNLIPPSRFPSSNNNIRLFGTNLIPPSRFPSSTSASLTNHQTPNIHNNNWQLTNTNQICPTIMPQNSEDNQIRPNHQTLTRPNSIRLFGTNLIRPPRFPSSTSASLTNHQTPNIHNNNNNNNRQVTNNSSYYYAAEQ